MNKEKGDQLYEIASNPRIQEQKTWERINAPANLWNRFIARNESFFFFFFLVIQGAIVSSNKALIRRQLPYEKDD